MPILHAWKHLESGQILSAKNDVYSRCTLSLCFEKLKIKTENHCMRRLITKGGTSVHAQHLRVSRCQRKEKLVASPGAIQGSLQRTDYLMQHPETSCCQSILTISIHSSIRQLKLRTHMAGPCLISCHLCRFGLFVKYPKRKLK